MLHLIPARLHRALLPLGHALRKAWMRTFKPRIAGVAVFITDDAGQVLLVRQSYGPRAWTMPAGGAGLSEDPALAIRREVREELACELTDLVMLYHGEEELWGARHHVHVFRARAASAPVADLREVLEARWFPRDALPRHMAGPLRRRLHLLDDPHL
ncbi:MAG: NUDIX domain-containing protein [Erythrobacter sp.]|nr:NUDIX domain-containing protein [Erythrobacter sp.]